MKQKQQTKQQRYETKMLKYGLIRQSFWIAAEDSETLQAMAERSRLKRMKLVDEENTTIAVT